MGNADSGCTRSRRDDFVLPYFTAPKPDQVVCILKARNGAHHDRHRNKEGKPLASAIEATVGPSIQLLYINTVKMGTDVRPVCPYFPFSARVCLKSSPLDRESLKQHGSASANRQNAFASCADPKILQQIAGSLSAKDLSRCGPMARSIDSILYRA